MSAFIPLSLTAQTAYAQLLDATQSADLARSVASLRGSFACKTVKTRTYWYFQYTEVSGRLKQLYVGPDSKRTRALIDEHAAGGPAQALVALARSAEALGCEPLLPMHFRVVQRLGEYGYFNAGGVLIGTHAFLAYGNMLGVHWLDSQRTQDVDVAHAGKSLAIALPSNIEIDTHAAIDSLQAGFLPLTGHDGKLGGGYMSPRDPDFQLDFLTPLHRGGMKSFRHPQLGVMLQPLKFMEYLLEDIEQATVFCTSGATLVNLPHPARYALHKLIVAGERPVSRMVKSNKDVQQSRVLIAALRERGVEWQVQEAWKDLVSRGPGWVARARRGRDALARRAPELNIEEWLSLPAG